MLELPEAYILAQQIKLKPARIQLINHVKSAEVIL
jgi:hypothetical protein